MSGVAGLPALQAPAALSVPGAGRRRGRARRLRGSLRWLLPLGWIALPVLPALGIGLSWALGIGLF